MDHRNPLYRRLSVFSLCLMILSWPMSVSQAEEEAPASNEVAPWFNPFDGSVADIPAEELASQIDAMVAPIPTPSLSQVNQFRVSQSELINAAISADGKRLATIDTDGTLAVWETDSGKSIREMKTDNSSPMRVVALSPDGSKMILGCADGEITVFDLVKDKIIATKNLRESPIVHVGFTLDGTCAHAMAENGLTSYFTDEGSTGSAGMFTGDDLPKVYHAVLGPQDYLTMSVRKNQFRLKIRAAGKSEFPFSLSAPEGSEACVAEGKDCFLASIGFDLVIPTINYKYKVPKLDTAACMQPVKHCRFTSNGQTIWIVTERSIDIRPRDMLRTHCIVPLPETEGETLKFIIAPDARRLVACQKDGKITIWQLEGDLMSSKYRVKRALDTLIDDKRFDAFEALGNLWAERYDVFWESEKDTLYSEMVSHLTESNRRKSGEPPLLAQYLKFIDANPDCQVMRVVAAQDYDRMAWRSRGGGYARGVSEEGWKGFIKNLEKGWKVLEPVMDRETPHAEAFVVNLRIARGLQWEKDDVGKLLTRAAKQSRNYHRIFSEGAISRLERWGGDPNDSVAVARRISNYIEGDEGDAMYAQIARHAHNFFGWSNFFDATGFEEDRVMRGFVYLSTNRPDARILNQGLYLAWMLDDKEAARTIAQQIQKERVVVNYKLWPNEDAGAFDDAMEWALEEEGKQ